MNQKIIRIFFVLLRSVITNTKMTDDEYSNYSSEMLPELLKIAARHDIEHLLILGLKQNGLLSQNFKDAETRIYKAVFRNEKLKYEYEKLCSTLENGKIPFVPLKGAIIRKYYPEAWMRTSCDIDILVRYDDLENSICLLSQNLQYEIKERTPHDISLFSPRGIHVELHFDLVEEGRANNAKAVLETVWDNVLLHESSKFLYEMSDEFFYFYHIAHMAKHFESGGCGARPFIDLWILDHMEDADKNKRDKLLQDGGLIKFANASRTLIEVWFGKREMDEISFQLQEFILHGGVYGSEDNRVAIQQKKKGGKFGYIASRIFVPYTKLKGYYPILEKHRWLMPVMQVRRWFMLLKPDVAKMAKKEIETNSNMDKSKAEQMNVLLENIGL